MKTVEELIKEEHRNRPDRIIVRGSDGFDNCIFVKIPRTGTNSINSVLKQSGGHRAASEWRAKYPIEWEELFTFSVVRHPYTRYLSAFYHIKLHEHHNVNDYLRDKGVMEDVIFQPQHTFLDIPVDKVYKFENLKEAWDNIQTRLGINKELPHLHKTGKKVELNEESKKYLADYYKVDFERFHYDS